jgi:hypothetical protein
MKIDTLKKLITKELRMADVHPYREEQIIKIIDLYEEDNRGWWHKLIHPQSNTNEKQSNRKARI